MKEAGVFKMAGSNRGGHYAPARAAGDAFASAGCRPRPRPAGAQALRPDEKIIGPSH